MKKLEEYVNETQVNEGFWKSLLGALGISFHDELGKKYPNFVKAFDELQKSDAEDKELIKMFNAQYDVIDKMELSDDEKVYQKIQLAMSQNARFEGEQKDKNITQLDKEKHKGYYEDIQAKLKDIEKNHDEIYKKYMEAAKKGQVKKEDVIGKGDKKEQEVPETVQQAGEHEDELINNLETLAAENEDLKKQIEELKKEKEKYDTKTAIEYAEKFFKFIDGLAKSDDGIDHNHRMKLNYVLSRLGLFANGANPHYDMVEDKEYYDYLIKKFNELNKEDSKETKEFVDAVNKGEVPEAKPTEDGDESQQAPTEAAAKMFGKDISAVLKDVGLSNSDFGEINKKTKQYMGIKETYTSLIDFISNINEAARDEVKNKIQQILSGKDEEAKKKLQAALTFIFVGYEGAKRIYGDDFKKAMYGLITEYDK